MVAADVADHEIVSLGFRVIVGLVFAAHGWAKRFKGGGLKGTAGWFDSIGMRPGALHAQLASGGEMLFGVMLALGLLTPFAAAGVVGIMVVAGWTVHRDKGFFIVGDGWEYTFMVAVMATAVAGFGAGEWSVDEALGLATDWDGLVGIGIAAVLGVVGGAAQLAVFYRPPAD